MSAITSPVPDAESTSEATDALIRRDVEELRSRTPDTKALYREVCALLFLRYGITPTAAMLYRYVRKGSMGVPAEQLALFWASLRSKLGVDMSHPAVPTEIREVAAQAIGHIWREALKGAQAEFEHERQQCLDSAEQARAQASQAKEELDMAVQAAQHVQGSLQQQLEHATQQLQALRSQLDAEREAHASTSGRLVQVQEQLRQEQQAAAEQREAARADTVQAREEVQAANARADEASRRAALAIDQARQGQIKAERLGETLRGQLATLEEQQRQQALAHAEQISSWQARSAAATALADQARRDSERVFAEVAALRAQLSSTQEDAARHRAEAQTLQRLLDQLSQRMDRLVPSTATETR